jgi:Asp/Glu/hydantoin racemase
MLPGLEVFHVVDESLIKNTIRSGRLTKSTIRRVVRLIEHAHDGGADVVMVTCSSIGPSVDVARRQLDFPILRVDEAMARTAVLKGQRIGVAATLRTTLDPTLELLRQMAAEAQRSVELVPRLCEGAFAAVVAGDNERHDTMVAETLRKLTAEVDVVVLAQASMARVVETLGASKTPILSSPQLAVEMVRDTFRREEATAQV